MNVASELESAWQSPPPLPTNEVALFHDIDGSLIEIAPTPEQVVVPEYLPRLMMQLRDAVQGALAVVTGRPLAIIDALLRPTRVAGAGLHGAEIRRHAEGETVREQGPSTEGVLEGLRQYFADDPRILVEDKEMTVALHYRLAPERAAECEAVASALASTMGFSVSPGKMVVEVLPPSANKGRAVRMLMESPPFAGRMPVFVGDDKTDEDGILVAQAMGGFGVKVGEGPSAAQYRLQNVTDVHRWLADNIRMTLVLP